MPKKKQTPICSICEQAKTRSEFPPTDRGTGISEYCITCKETYANHVFIMNKCNYAIDVRTPEEADLLIVHQLIEFKNNQYRTLNELDYNRNIKGKPVLSAPTDYVLAIGKYGEKRYAVRREKAQQTVLEGAAVWGNDTTIHHLFSGKELEHLVLKRDKYTCYYCEGKGTILAFITPRTQGGLLSPQNSVACCKTCKEINGENLFFFKWLNIPIVDKQGNQMDDILYTMYDPNKQTLFWITEKDANTLLEDEMAELVGKKCIRILYNEKEFKAYILNRDEKTCFYCDRYGDTVDHVVPLANGGMSTPKNCVCACAKCNLTKSDLDKQSFIEQKRPPK